MHIPNMACHSDAVNFHLINTSGAAEVNRQRLAGRTHQPFSCSSGRFLWSFSINAVLGITESSVRVLSEFNDRTGSERWWLFKKNRRNEKGASRETEGLEILFLCGRWQMSEAGWKRMAQGRCYSLQIACGSWFYPNQVPAYFLRPGETHKSA